MAESRKNGIRPLVIKVGGSLAETGRLGGTLAMLSAAQIPIVIVPGGGPFAEAVRSLQREIRFNDVVAHRLAMLAMEQMAEWIVSERFGLKVARSIDEISDCIMDGQIPVWAPLRMIGDDETISANWSVTSDSLSVRLAELLGARLILLKSVDVADDLSAEDLARQGVVDGFFPEIVARAGVSWSIFGPAGDAALAAILAGEGAD
ncbi:uridylate kinase [Hyphomicrobium sp.]|uniref:amino acid kinase family protein n=1 Tax=Hyphomicrobium sp. TaxID=82 RepID=UPI001E192A32|nr:uridylate kinase [Hyphomicrobium sp.]MBY0560532.1 uridylate kinase [Hyphomicrobium sp.]